MPSWYENTPTVWSVDGMTIYINPTEDMKKKVPDDWKERAEQLDSFPVVVTRKWASIALSGVDAKDISSAKIAAATIDCSTDTKSNTAISVVEFDKCVRLVEAKLEALEEVPLEDIEVESKQ